MWTWLKRSDLSFRTIKFSSGEISKQALVPPTLDCWINDVCAAHDWSVFGMLMVICLEHWHWPTFSLISHHRLQTASSSIPFVDYWLWWRVDNKNDWYRLVFKCCLLSHSLITGYDKELIINDWYRLDINYCLVSHLLITGYNEELIINDSYRLDIKYCLPSHLLITGCNAEVLINARYGSISIVNIQRFSGLTHWGWVTHWDLELCHHLVWVICWHLIGAKPLPEPMLTQGVQRSGKSQGNSRLRKSQGKVREFCWRSGKKEYWEKSGNLHLVQSKK